MTQDQIIILLLSIIGFLVAAFVSYYVWTISRDIAGLRDCYEKLSNMFTTHVQNTDIHVVKGNLHGMA